MMPGLWAPRDWLRDIDSEDFQQSADQIIGTVMPAIDAAKSQATDAIQSTAQAGAQAYQQAATSLPKFTIPSLSSLTAGWGDSTSQPSTSDTQLDTTSTGVDAPTTSSQPAASPLSRFTIPNLTSLLSGWEAPKPPETVGSPVTSATSTPAPSGAETVSAPGMPTATPSGQPAAPVALPDRLDTSSRDANLRQWAPALQDIERRTGLRADALGAIIQAENGGGQSPLSAKDNNYFSISYVPGRPNQAGPGTGGRFAAYATPQDSLNDFVDLIQKHYPEAWANRSDPQKFFQGLVKGGYIVEEPGFPVSTWLNNLETGRQHFAAIAPAPAPSGQAAAPSAARGTGGLDVNSIVSAYKDTSYTYGGPGGRTAGFGAPTDCSGFVAAVYQNQYGLSLVPHTDGAYNQLRQAGAAEVTVKDAQPGDVVFYMGAGTGGAITHHMGIYAGDGKVLDDSVSGADGVHVRDVGHAGQYVILRDPRLNAQTPQTASVPPPIQPAGVAEATGGEKVSNRELQAQAQADQPTMYRQPLGPATAGPDTTDVGSPTGPPVRDDYATAGSSPPAVAPAAQVIPQEDPTAIPRPAYVPPAMPLVTAPEQPVVPNNSNQFAGGLTSPPPAPRFNPLEGQAQPPRPGELPPRNAPPPPAPLIEQSTPTPASSTAPYNPLANQPPAQPGELPARPGVVEPTPVTEVGAVGAATRGNAPPPAVPDVVQAVNRGETVNPFHWANQVSDAAADQVVQSVGIDPESAQGIASKFVIGAVVNPINWEGGAFSATAEAAARAGLPFLRAALPAIAERFGAETAGRVSTWLASQGSELAANVAGQAAAGAVTNPEAPGFGAAFGGGTAAVLGPAGRVIGRGVGAVGSELRAGAERAAAVEAERAGQRAAVAPGVFGVAPPEAGPAAEAVARPRFVPPDVRERTTPNVELPDDPRFQQAVENVGGQITDRGVELHVTRAQGETAAGQTATRGGVFVEPVREGGRSRYVTSSDDPNSVGGTVALPPTKTLYRKPLVVDSEAGSPDGFDAVMERLGLGVDQQALRTAQEEAWRLREHVRDLDAGAHPEVTGRQYQQAIAASEAAEQRVEDLIAAVPTSGGIDTAIRQARRAGPEGSPARAAALKDLVSRYGGDPALIDDLLKIRGADASESAWAIKENIVAANARRQGYDGVFTLQGTMSPAEYRAALEKAVQAHPEYQAQQAVVDGLAEQGRQMSARSSEASRIYGHGSPEWNAINDEWNALHDRLEPARRKLDNIHDRLIDTVEVPQPTTISEIFDVQQGRNPTPGVPNPRLEALRAQHEAALNRLGTLEMRQYKAPTPQERQRLGQMIVSARDEAQNLERQVISERATPYTTPPGYSLHPDVVPPSQGAAATAGITPVPVRQHTDVLASVNKALSQGVASAVSGGVGAATNQQLNPDDPNAALKGFAVGAVAPFALSRGARALASRAGREAGRTEGALATLGGLPLQVQRAVTQAKAQQQPGLSPLEWTRRFAGEVGYSSMIGPATFSVNVLGNLMEPLWSIPKEATRAVARGTPREFVEMAGGAFHGLGQLGTAMVDALAARGRYASVPGHEPLSAVTNNPIGKAITTGLEVGGRVFSALPDAVFGTIAQGAGEARAAAQRATDMGLTGASWKQHVNALLADAEQVKAGQLPSMTGTQDVLDAGKAYARRQTFQDELGDIGKRARTFARIGDMPVVGNLVTPFFNTPWNMNLRMAERTPAGFAMNSQGGRFDKYYDATLGSALLIGLAAGPVASGTITGGGPDDPQKKAELRSQGWRPYSTLVDGVYVPNRVFGIYAPLLNAAADVHDSIAYAKDSSPASITSDYVGRFGKQLQQQPYLQGMANIMQAIQSDQGGGLTGAAERYASSTLTRMVPYAATARTIGTAADPSERAIDQGKNVPAATTIGEQVQQGVGLRSGLPVAQDVLGQPQSNPQAGAGAFFAKTSSQRPQPVVQAFLDAGVDIPSPRTEITVGGAKLLLDEHERRRWNEVRGAALSQALGPLTQSGALGRMPAGVREQLLRRFLDASAQQADTRVFSEMAPADRTQRIRDAVNAKLQKAS